MTSPTTATAAAPSGGKPWADGPLALVPTPVHEVATGARAGADADDIFIKGASHMALLHNAVLRGYNSIRLQAAHVRAADVPDFVGYCLAWHRFVASHHDDEEAVLFRDVEALLRDDAVWAETHREHEAFLPGLAEFHAYLVGPAATSAATFSADELLRIMDGFERPFEHHFRSEVQIIAALADHPNAPKPGTPEAVAAAATFASWGKKTVMKAGLTDVVPFFLMNLDRDFEQGRWANWPPIPPPIKWSLVNLVGSWYGGRWRFSSCDGAGGKRELYALS